MMKVFLLLRCDTGTAYAGIGTICFILPFLHQEFFKKNHVTVITPGLREGRTQMLENSLGGTPFKEKEKKKS